MMTDSISDMLIRIKNAQLAGKDFVLVPHSKIKFEIAKIIAQRDFIGELRRLRKKNQRFIEIELKYENSRPKITQVQRVSKPGRRVYAKSAELRPIRNGLGLGIISTSRGLMTFEQARKQKLGGEVICKVY